MLILKKVVYLWPSFVHVRTFIRGSYIFIQAT